MVPMVNGEPRNATSTRARLVAATLAELDERGYRASRVDEIARRAGLTSGAIYARFRTKHELLAVALLERDPEGLRGALAPRRRWLHEPQLFDAALEAMDAKGYRGARVAAIARRAGLTVDAVSARYPTKHRLLITAMVAEGREGFRSAIGQAVNAVEEDEDDSSTQERLLAATMSVLDEKGYRGATVSEIARRAGLTTGAIYGNFGSKHELLNTAMAIRYETLFRSALDQAGSAGDDLLEALGEILSQDASVEHKALIEIMAAASRDESVRGALAAQFERRSRLISELIDAGKASGVVAPNVPTATLAHVVQLLALGNVVGQAVGMGMPPKEEITRVLGLLGAGLRADRGQGADRVARRR